MECRVAALSRSDAHKDCPRGGVSGAMEGVQVPIADAPAQGVLAPSTLPKPPLSTLDLTSP